MKATLVKKQEGWYNLYQNDIGIGSTHVELQGHKVSPKNCQEIERGYDLDELAMRCDLYENINFVGQMRAYKAGFQKALEVNADKRFTLKEMVECWNRALEFQTHKETLGEYIKSLKQTEWDVEIVTTKEEYTWSPPGEGFEDQTYRDWREVPKLDADGCLILKKV